MYLLDTIEHRYIVLSSLSGGTCCHKNAVSCLCSKNSIMLSVIELIFICWLSKISFTLASSNLL